MNDTQKLARTLKVDGHILRKRKWHESESGINLIRLTLIVIVLVAAFSIRAAVLN